MKSAIICLVIFAGLVACNTKSMTLEELKTASWHELDNGIEYISLKNNTAESSDSIHYAVKGFLGSNITISANALNELQPTLDTLLSKIINDHLPESKHGYLKIDFYKMFSPEFLTATAYLRGDIDSADLSIGIIKLKEIKGVEKVTYVSKDMAKKKYLDAGNEDWEKVLESNPLPASIEIEFDKKIIAQEHYESFKTKITDQMLLYISDVSIPPDPLKKFENNYYILEYDRR